MSNLRVVNFFKISDPPLGNIVTALHTPSTEIKTYFTNYKNPIGIEIEAENIHKTYVSNFWHQKPDGSLKIKGSEFVSYPLSGNQIDYAIEEVAGFLAKEAPLWSHRTSIHVHVNVSALTVNQLRALVGLYGVYENLFFLHCNRLRKGNGFCYPATSVATDVYAQINKDNKYCALNLAPIKTQCTIEFRHLEGNGDWKKLRRWIQLIVKLHKYCSELESAKAVEFVRQLVLTQGAVTEFERIFGATARLFTQLEVESSLIDNGFWTLQFLDKELT